MKTEEINALSNKLIGFGITVHKSLGPGLVEKIYSKALEYELVKNKIRVTREKYIKIEYDNLTLGEFRLDFLVEDEVIIEIKAVYKINNFHMAQILTYLKATNRKLGLILNFSRPKLEIKRVVNNL